MISEQNIEEAGSKNFDTIHLNFLKAYRKAIDIYREVNMKKADNLDYAYKFLGAYFIFSIIMAIFIVMSFIFGD